MLNPLIDAISKGFVKVMKVLYDFVKSLLRLAVMEEQIKEIKDEVNEVQATLDRISNTLSKLACTDGKHTH